MLSYVVDSIFPKKILHFCWPKGNSCLGFDDNKPRLLVTNG